MALKKPKEPIIHKDKFGRVIEVGNCVVYPVSNSMIIGMVRKLNPKMIGVTKLGSSGWYAEKNKYPDDVVVVDGPEVTAYILKNSSRA